MAAPTKGSILDKRDAILGGCLSNIQSFSLKHLHTYLAPAAKLFLVPCVYERSSCVRVVIKIHLGNRENAFSGSVDALLAESLGSREAYAEQGR